jgi:hypothetical protein
VDRNFHFSIAIGAGKGLKEVRRRTERGLSGVRVDCDLEAIDEDRNPVG